MNIAFVNFHTLIFDVDTPYQKPLGGSESAMCYLAEQLAKMRHKVFLLTRLSQKSEKRGVICIPFEKVPNDILTSLDILIVQNTPLEGFKMKRFLNKKTKIILWTQHAPDQPAVQSIAKDEIRNCFDAFVMVSTYQLNGYISAFGLDKTKCVIFKNAIAPAFENLFQTKDSLLNQKKMPPVLAYTSTPFRGLDLLIRIFPAIRHAVPNISLRIYSDMKIYQTRSELEQKEYGDLYRLCRETEGVEYIGSISQPDLAKELHSVSVLTYPNTFAETSCISVMEAMAAGCQIITSKLGALPETATGFAKLIPMDLNYNQNFINATVAALKHPTDKSKQVAFVKNNYIWTNRALEWDKFLTKVII